MQRSAHNTNSRGRSRPRPRGQQQRRSGFSRRGAATRRRRRFSCDRRSRGGTWALTLTSPGTSESLSFSLSPPTHPRACEFLSARVVLILKSTPLFLSAEERYGATKGDTSPIRRGREKVHIPDLFPCVTAAHVPLSRRGANPLSPARQTARAFTFLLTLRSYGLRR